jgi:hypothetical protein
MKSTYQLAIVSFVLLLWSACRNDDEWPIKPLANEQVAATELNLMGCDDTSAFKSIVDLQPLVYLQNCYSCTAIKQVPGLGEIPWEGNCGAAIIWDTVLLFGFGTKELHFGQFLDRERGLISTVPISVGTYQVFDGADWAVDPSKSFASYSRVLDDGDVGDGHWGVDTSCTNYIEITRLDLEDKEIEGRFELHLKMKTQGSHGILYSERINFLNGRFRAEIFD